MKYVRRTLYAPHAYTRNWGRVEGRELEGTGGFKLCRTMLVGPETSGLQASHAHVADRGWGMKFRKEVDTEVLRVWGRKGKGERWVRRID